MVGLESKLVQQKTDNKAVEEMEGKIKKLEEEHMQ